MRVRPKKLEEPDVTRVGRITGVEKGKPVVGDGRALDVSNVIWCTGYRRGFDWIDIPVFDDQRLPIHQRGIVAKRPWPLLPALDVVRDNQPDSPLGTPHTCAYRHLCG